MSPFRRNLAEVQQSSFRRQLHSNGMRQGFEQSFELQRNTPVRMNKERGKWDACNWSQRTVMPLEFPGTMHTD